MNIFENKSILKKIVIILLIVIVSSFCFSGKVNADDGGVGGKLLSPIADLIVFLGDGLMNIIHSVIFHQSDTTIVIDLASGFWNGVVTVLVGVVAAVAVGALVVLTGGVILPALIPAVTAVGAGTVIAVSVTAGVAAGALFNANCLPDDFYLPVYQISPEEIFSNEVLLFDVDFFTPKSSEVLSDGTIRESTANILRGVVSGWYTILRNIAIVALLSILVYVGIRILISSTSNDKAKYKQMLMDWLIAICLLFVMQYIMSFSNIIVGKITELVTVAGKENGGYIAIIEDSDNKISDELEERGYDVSTMKQGDNMCWPTNLMGMMRIQAQFAKEERTSYAGYALLFLILVLFTIYFIFTYLKRVLYMAFLTIIAPLVALTYPIDKINDGKAQAFNMWLKEYIFNLLIQPMHLLLYYILVLSAFQLASENVIYSLVALGFMIPAEKLMRKFFGFEKAHTPGLLAGPAGAAVTMTAMNKLFGRGQKNSGKSSGSGSDSSKQNDNARPPRINSKFDKQSGALGDGNQYARNDNSNIDDNVPIDTNNPIDKDSPINNNAPIDNNVPIDNNNIEDNEYGNGQDQKHIDGKDDIGDPLEGNNSDMLPDGNDIDTEKVQPDEFNFDGLDFDDTNNRSNINDKNINEKPASEITFPEDIRTIKKPSIGQRMAKNVKAYSPKAFKYYGKGLTKKLENKVKNSHPLHSAVRLAGGVALGAAAAGVGAAVGITSGDFSKGVQYTTAAAVGGYKLGKGRVSGGIQTLQVDGMKEMQERAKYASENEYKEEQQRKYIEQYQKNIDNQFKLEQKYGKKKSKQIMKNVVPQCLDNGITNINDIIAINEMLDKNIVQDVNMGISTAKYASRLGSSPKNMKKKDRDEWHKTLTEEFGKNEKVIKNNLNSEDIATTIMNRINKFNDIKDEI